MLQMGDYFLFSLEIICLIWKNTKPVFLKVFQFLHQGSQPWEQASRRALCTMEKIKVETIWRKKQEIQMNAWLLLFPAGLLRL